jgi:hypothetical protein
MSTPFAGRALLPPRAPLMTERALPTLPAPSGTRVLRWQLSAPRPPPPMPSFCALQQLARALCALVLGALVLASQMTGPPWKCVLLPTSASPLIASPFVVGGLNTLFQPEPSLMRGLLPPLYPLWRLQRVMLSLRMPPLASATPMSVPPLAMPLPR